MKNDELSEMIKKYLLNLTPENQETKEQEIRKIY